MGTNIRGGRARPKDPVYPNGPIAVSSRGDATADARHHYTTAPVLRHIVYQRGENECGHSLAIILLTN